VHGMQSLSTNLSGIWLFSFDLEVDDGKIFELH